MPTAQRYKVRFEKSEKKYHWDALRFSPESPDHTQPIFKIILRPNTLPGEDGYFVAGVPELAGDLDKTGSYITANDLREAINFMESKPIWS
jgi:hypothetical protein